VLFLLKLHNPIFNQRKRFHFSASARVKLLLIIGGYLATLCGSAIATRELSANDTNGTLTGMIKLNGYTLSINQAGTLSADLIGPGTLTKTGTGNLVFSGRGSSLTTLNASGAISFQGNAVINTGTLKVDTTSVVAVGNSSSSVVLMSCGKVDIVGGTSFCIGGNESTGTVVTSGKFGSSDIGANNIYIGTVPGSTAAGSGILLAKNAIIGEKSATNVYLAGNSAASYGFFFTDETTTINSGSSITIGHGNAGRGSLSVGTVLTCNGTITCNKVGEEGFLVHTLAGSSTGLITLSNTTSEMIVQGGTYAGKFDGVGKIIKNGSADLTLSGDSSFSGTFDLNNGTLILQNNLGSGTINVASGQSLKIDCSGTVGYASNISGAGSLTKASAGAATLSGSFNTYTGSIRVVEGTLVLNNGIPSTNTSGITISSGTTLEAKNTLGGGTISLNAGTLNIKNTVSVTYGNSIVGPGTLNKTEAGNLIFTGNASALTALNVQGAISLEGNAAINTGTLKIATTTAAVSVGKFSGSVAQIVCDSIDLVGSTNFCIGESGGSGTITATGVFGSSATGANNVYIGTNANKTTAGSGFLRVKRAIIGEKSVTNIYLAGGNAASDGSFISDESTTINSGSSFTIGHGTVGTGSFTVGTILTCDGTITCNKVGTNGFVVHGLDGTNTNAQITLNNSSIMTIEGTGTSGYAGKISGSNTSKIVKNGDATLLLSGASTFLGTFELNGGSLILQNDLGSGSINLGSGLALYLNCTGGVEYKSRISGAGLLHKTGSGTATLSGTLSYTEATTVTEGKLITNNAMSTSGIIVASGATLEGKSTLGSGTITNNGSLILAGAETYSNVINGSGKLEKAGNGETSLIGTLGYTGETKISAGTLTLGSALATGNAAQITIVEGANLNTSSGLGTGAIKNSGTLFLAGDLTYGNSFTNEASGTLTRSGTGDGVVYLNNVASMTGNVIVTGGTLKLGPFTTTGKTLSVLGATSTYELVGAQSYGIITGNGIIDLKGLTLETKTGGGDTSQFTGKLTGTGTYTHSGNWQSLNTTETSSIGILNVSTNGSLDIGRNGTGYLTATTVNIGGSLAVGSGSSANGTLNATTVNVNNTLLVGAGGGTALVLATTMNVKGTLKIASYDSSNISGTVTVSGGMTVDSGKAVTIGNSSDGKGKLTVASTMENNGTITVTKLIDNDSSFAVGALKGSGSIALNGTTKMYIKDGSGQIFPGTITSVVGTTFVKEGSGTQTLSGTLTGHAGATTVSAGKLITVNAVGTSGITIASNATLEARNTLGNGAINNAGTLTLVGNVTYSNSLTSSGTLTRNGTGVAELSSITSLTGDVTVLAGTLKLGEIQTTGNALTVSSGATYELAGSQNYNYVKGSSGTLDIKGFTLDIKTGGGVAADQRFSGKLLGTGTYIHSGVNPQVLNITTGSSIGTFRVDGAVYLADYSSGILAASTVNVTKTLLVGSNSGGNGTLNAGAVTVENGGSMYIGIASGTGVVTAETLSIAGNFGIAGNITGEQAGTSGIVTVSDSMTVAATGSVAVGSTAKGKLTVANILTNNGAVTVKNLIDDSSFSVGALEGTGSTTLNAGKMYITDGSGITYSGTFTSASGTTLIKNGIGTQTFSGASNALSGATTINAGKLILNYSLGTGTITLNSDGKLVLDTEGNDRAYSMPIAGTGVLEKTSAGTATISGASFNGAISIKGGGLASTTSLGSVGISIENGCKFVIDNDEAQEYANAFTGEGTIEKIKGGVATLTVASNLSASGKLDITAGGVILNNVIGEAAINIAADKSLTISNTGTLDYNNNITGTGLFSKINNGTANMTKTVDVKSTTVSGGKLIAKSTFNAATLNVTAGEFSVSAGTTTISGATTVSSVMTADSTFKSGTLGVTFGLFRITAGTTTISGATTMSGGGITAGGTFNSASLGLTGGAFSVSAGTINITGATSLYGAASSITVDGTFKSGSMNITGSTFRTNSGTSTITNELTFELGTLSVAQGATCTAGSTIQKSGYINVIGTLNSGNLAISGGSETISGAIKSGAVTMSAGSVTITGAGSTATSYAISGSGSLSIEGGSLAVTGSVNVTGGTFNQFGEFSAGSMTIAASQLVTVGRATGTVLPAKFTVSNKLTCNGTLTIDKIAENGPCQVLQLEGTGTVNLNGGSTLKITNKNDNPIFSGMFNDSSKTGTLHFTENTGGSGHVFNTSENSNVANLIVDKSYFFLGWTAAGTLTCKNVDVRNFGRFRVGTEANGDGTLTCDSMSINGSVSVGSYGGVGTITCSGTITQTGDNFEVGTSANATVGTGIIRADELIISGGTAHIAHTHLAASGTVILTRLTIGTEGVLSMGHGDRTFTYAELTVSGIATCNGKIVAEVPSSKGSISFGGLNGGTAAVINLHASTVLNLNPASGVTCTYNGQIAKAASSVSSVVKDESGVQIFTGENTYVGGTTVKAGTLCGAIGFNGALVINSAGTYRVATTASGNTGGITPTLNGALTGAGTLDLANGTLTLNASSTFDGPIIGAGKLIKTNTGSVILTHNSKTYTGGTEVNAGTLCGEIGFNSTLAIANGATYRLALNSTGTTDSTTSLTRTLNKAISGAGTLNLAQGCLTLAASSTFNGVITNTNTDPSKTILILGQNDLLFSAGAIINETTGESIPHTAVGTIKYASGNGAQYIAGNFPECYLDVEYGACYVDLSVKQAVFKGLISIAVDLAALKGNKALIITEGFDGTEGFGSFCRTALGYHWGGDFTGQIIKRGTGRQILFKRGSLSGDIPDHTGETRVEGGTLAGVVSPNAPLFVAGGALYQICCYEGATNHTGITTQQIKGLYGTGNVDLGDFAASKDGSLTVSVDSGGSFSFDGQLRGKTIFTKIGDGKQVVSTAQGNFKGQILVKNSGALEFNAFTGDGAIQLADSANYKMLGNQVVGAIVSDSTTTTFDVNSKVLTLNGLNLAYNGKLIDTGANGKIYLPGTSQSFNTQSGSTVRTLDIENGTLYIGNGHAGTITTTDTVLKSGMLVVGTDGAGTMEANAIYLSAGTTFKIGATNSAATVGTVTTATMSVESGASVIIGNGAGKGSFIATGKVSCEGTITIDKMVNAESCKFFQLSGSGMVNLNGGSTLKITTNAVATFSGKFYDESNTGTLYFTTNTGNGQVFNTSADSNVGTLKVDGSSFFIGAAGMGALISENVDVFNSGRLFVGRGTSGNGSLTCDTMSISGNVCVGSNTGTGTLKCNGTITQTSGDFWIGTAYNTQSNTSIEPGIGTLVAEELIINGGVTHIAHTATAASATVTLDRLTISTGGQLAIGCAPTNFTKAELTVNGIATCNGKLAAEVSTSKGFVHIGGLAGTNSGAFVYLHSATELNINTPEEVSCTYTGKIDGTTSSLVKSGAGVQIFSGSSSYTGGTTIKGGMLCGQIGFGSALNIASGATYRLACNSDGKTDSTNSITATLTKPVSGNGTLDLAQGRLKLTASSTNNCKIVNTNKNMEKVILTLSATLDAGDVINASTSTSLEHTAEGTITFEGAAWKYIAGNYPKCFLSGVLPGYTGIDVQVKRAVFAAIFDDNSRFHIRGDKPLVITNGLESTDFRRALLSCNGTAFGVFTGQVIKQGAGRQIFHDKNVVNDTPIHTGETRVEGGTLAGVLSPNAPLFVDNGTTYQISCYNGAENCTNITAQTVKGLRGSGVIAFAAADRTQDAFTIDVATGASETFNGQIIENGIVNKIGAGEQIITGELLNPMVNVNAGRLAFASVIRGRKEVNVSAATLAVTGGFVDATLNLKSSSSVFKVASMTNINVRLNVMASGAMIETEAASQMLSSVNLANDVNIKTAHNLRIDGTFRGAGNLIKIGAETLTLGEVNARNCRAMIEVDAGNLNISNRADLGEHMGLKVGTTANLYSNQTFRTIDGLGTIYMHTHNLDLKLDSDITYAGKLVGETERNVVAVYGNATFGGSSLAEHIGWLDAKNGSNVHVTSASSPQLKLRLEKDSKIRMSGDRTFNGVEGAGTLIGDVGSEHIIITDKTQTFVGDVIGPRLIFDGSQTFHWGGTGTKQHSTGITLDGSAKLIVDRNTLLNPLERVHLNTSTSQVHLTTSQVVAGVSGGGTLYASNLRMELTEDITFSGDIVGQGTYFFKAVNTDKKVKFILEGAPKSFKGRFITDGSVELVFPQGIFYQSVIVSGQATTLTENKTFDGKQLAELIDLHGNVAKIQDTEDISSSGFFKGPGKVEVACEKTLTIEKGVIGTDAVIFDVQRGHVIAASGATFENATIELNGNQSVVEFRSSSNLDSTSTVRVVTDTGVLQFTGSAPISNSATFEINQSTRFQTLVDTTLLGELRGHEEISKEGAGFLRVNETESRKWIVRKGMLAGTFHEESCVQLGVGTTFSITGPQTLCSLNSTSSSAKLLGGGFLTLTGVSEYAGAFYDPVPLKIAKGADFTILGGWRNCLAICVNGILRVKDAGQRITIFGDGKVYSDHDITLGSSGSYSFTGAWIGKGDIYNGTNRTYTIGGDFQSHTGNIYSSAGTIVLTEDAVLGKGLFRVTNSTLMPYATTNINGALQLNNAVVRTSTDMQITTQVSVEDAATFDVRNKTLILTCPINGNAQINKTGNGSLFLYDNYAQPIRLAVNAGDVEIYGKLHPETQLVITGLCAIEKAQTVQNLSGTGILALLDSITLKSQNPIAFAGTIIGTPNLTLAEGTTASFTNADWNELFGGRIVLKKNSTLNLLDDQVIRQINGEGSLNLHGANLTMEMNANQSFSGIFENVGTLIFENMNVLTSEDVFTFTMQEKFDYAQCIVKEKAVLQVECPAIFGRLHVEHGGEVIFAKTAYGYALTGSGDITINENLSLELQEDCIFDGDLKCSKTINLLGIGGLTLNDAKSFKGLMNIKNAALNLGAALMFTDHVVVNIDAARVLRMNSDQSLSDVIGRGLVDLQGHTLRILQNTDSSEHFYGDFTPGVLILDSLRSWCWDGTTKDFDGVLDVTARSHLVLQSITSLKSVVLVCDGEVEATAPIELKKLQGAGTVKHSATFSVREDSNFAGNIEGKDFFKVSSGRFIWSDGYKSPSGLEISSVFEAHSKLDQNDPIVLNGDDSELKLFVDHEFTNLQGTGVINANTKCVAFLGDVSFKGRVKEASEVDIQGKILLDNICDCQTLKISENSSLTLNTSTGLQQLALSANSLLSLKAAETFCKSLSGHGRINCNGNTLELSESDEIFEFSGDIEKCTLILTNHHLRFCGQGRKSLMGEICLKELSIFDVTDAISLNEKESIVVAQEARLNMHGYQSLSKIQGTGTVTFEELTIQPQDSFAFGGHFVSEKNLTFKNVGNPSCTVILSGNSDSFVGKICCDGLTIDMLESCTWKNNSLTLQHQANLILHNSDTLPELSTIVVAGQNTLTLGENLLNLHQGIFIPSDSELIVDVGDYIGTLSGGIMGVSTLTKIGNGALNIDNKNDFSGNYNVVSGRLRLIGEMTHRFGLNIDEYGAVDITPNVLLHTLAGKGSIELSANSTAKLYVTSDVSINTSINNGMFEMLTDTDGIKSVEFGADLHAATLMVGTNVALHAPNLNEQVNADISGTLDCESQRFMSLSVTATGKVFGDDLSIIGDNVNSILRGEVHAASISYNNSNKDTLLGLFEGVQLESLQIAQGLAFMNSAAKIEKASIDELGEFYGVGELKSLEFSGVVVPGRLQEYVDEKESLFGALQVKNVLVRSGARLQSLLDSSRNGSFCSVLRISDSVENLQNLSIILTTEKIDEIKNRDFVLMALPGGHALDKLPHIDFRAGICPLLEAPQDSLSLTIVQDQLILHTGELRLKP
jgi:autotransporter-associated beta strand protein